MNDIRKYIQLIESEILEGKRQDAITTIESHAYNIALHFTKLRYMSDHTASNHWIVELKNFINDIIKKTSRSNIKKIHIHEYLSSNVLSVQARNKIISEIHNNYYYITIDLDDLYTFINDVSFRLASIIDNGNKIDYNDIHELINVSIRGR